MAQSAGKFTGALSSSQSGIRNSHRMQEFKNAGLTLSLAERGVQSQHIINFAANGSQGVEGHERILQDQPHGCSANASPPSSTLCRQSFSRQAELVEAHVGTRGRKPEQGARRDALARTRFADDGKAFPGCHLETDPIDSSTGGAVEVHAEVGHDEKGGGGHPLASCRVRALRARPSTVNAAAVATIASPGNTVSHHATSM